MFAEFVPGVEMRTEEQNEYQIQSDGKTVWINGNDGMCVARFSRHGIDIHRSFAEQLATGSQCLDCEHGDDIDYSHWQRFKSRVKELFGVEVTKHRPKFIGELH